MKIRYIVIFIFSMDRSDFSENAFGKVIFTSREYFAFIPNALPPHVSWSQELFTALSQANSSIAKLSAVGSAFPSPRIIVRPFIHNEAVLSSRIEGTQTSLEGLFSYQLGQLSFFTDSNDAQEVHNYVQALDYGLERLNDLPISSRLIRELHTILLKDVRGGRLTPGKFRTTQNWIGNPGSTISTAKYVPPPVPDMDNCLTDLEKFIHQPSKIPPLLRIGMIHYQFEAIHPFLDGNGRIGRLLISLLLSVWGLLPIPLLSLSEYIEQNRQEYYKKLLAVSQHGEWEQWLIFFLDGLNIQSEIAVDRINKIQALREKYRTLIEDDWKQKNLSLVIDYLLGHPITNIKQAQKDLDIGSFTTIQRYFSKLERFGILTEVTGKSRNRIFRADEVMQIIQSK